MTYQFGRRVFGGSGAAFGHIPAAELSVAVHVAAAKT
jgi:hypothetical protein